MKDKKLYMHILSYWYVPRNPKNNCCFYANFTAPFINYSMIICYDASFGLYFCSSMATVTISPRTLMMFWTEP